MHKIKCEVCGKERMWDCGTFNLGYCGDAAFNLDFCGYECLTDWVKSDCWQEIEKDMYIERDF